MAARIYLRRVARSDQQEFLAAVRASRALHRPWTHPPSTPQSPRYLKIGAHWRGHERWAILAS